MGTQTAPVEGTSPRPWARADWRLRWQWHVLATTLWGLSLAVSSGVSLDGWALDIARGLHLVGAVVGLGAILLVDWCGLVWMSGLRTFRETLRVGEAAHPLVWFGLLLLLISGAALSPDLGSVTTWLKQVAVLLLINNGVFVRRLGARLTALPPRLTSMDDMPDGLRRSVIATVTVSQLSWWVAVVVGYLTTTRAR